MELDTLKAVLDERLYAHLNEPKGVEATLAQDDNGVYTYTVKAPAFIKDISFTLDGLDTHKHVILLQVADMGAMCNHWRSDIRKK